jgi:hypothetical protein
MQNSNQPTSQLELTEYLQKGDIEAANAKLEEYSESCGSSVGVRLDSSQEGFFLVYVGDSTQPLHVSQDVEEVSKYAVELVDGNF